MYRAIPGSKRACNSKIPRFFLTILLVAPIYAGNIYYVDGTIGNDSNPGIQSSPWKTIQRAADMMVAGDSVMVNGGSYGERVRVTTSGSSGNAITYRVNPGDTVTCKGFTIHGSYVTVDGFKIDAEDNDWFTGRGCYVSSRHVTIKNCYVAECPWGGIFFAGSSSYGYVFNNRCYHNGNNGIEIRGRYHLVENNEVWESVQHHPQGEPGPEPDADGVRFHGDHHIFRGNWIHEPALLSDPHNIDPHIDCFQTFTNGKGGEAAGNHCIFERNHLRHYVGGMYAFMISGSKGSPPHNITIRNNILEVGLGVDISNVDGSGGYDYYICNNTFIGLNTYIAIDIDHASNIKIKNNITVDYDMHRNIVNCRKVAISHNCAYNTDGSTPLAKPSRRYSELWSLDPKFVSFSGRDFHLQSVSPCINAGRSLFKVKNDFDGDGRPQGAKWEIGADEDIASGTALNARSSASHTSEQASLTSDSTFSHNASPGSSTPVDISAVSDTTAELGLSAETGAPAPGNGGTTDPAPGDHSYSAGSTVEASPIPDADYRFSKWGGDIADANRFIRETSITLNTSKSLIATFCTKCADVNGDLKITSLDARLAFDLYLGIISSPTWCELENADVNCSGTKLKPSITPSDARMILNKFLKKATTSSDCSGNLRAAATSPQNILFGSGPFIIDHSFLTSEDDILIPIIIESPKAIGAFGFDLAFPSDNWTYVGLERTDLTNNYDQLAGNVVSYKVSDLEKSSARQNKQFLRVGGYKTTVDNSASVGVLVTLVFRAKKGFVEPSEVSIIAAYDDLQNAMIYAGSNIQSTKNELGTENRGPVSGKKAKA